MDITTIKLPFILDREKIPLLETEMYCCKVFVPHEAREEHYHIGYTHLELREKYEIVEFSRYQPDYKNHIDSRKYYNWFEDCLYPMILMVDFAGAIMEVCNTKEILDKIEKVYKEVISPYLSDEAKKEITRYYKVFNYASGIFNHANTDPVLNQILFPLHTLYLIPIRIFISKSNKDGELHQKTFSAKINETLDEFGNIKIDLTGISNMNSHFYVDANYTYDPVYHILQSTNMETVTANGEPVRVECKRFII